LSNQAELNKYHIVFLPCSGSGHHLQRDGVERSHGAGQSAAVRQGRRQGLRHRLLVRLRAPAVSGYVDWVGQTSALGSACQGRLARRRKRRIGMAAWLAAVGVTSFEVKANWTIVDKVNAVNTTDLDGNPTVETPKSG
jgi:hypothetical protein